MARLTDEQRKEYDKLMADPATAAKARTLLGGLLDEFEEADTRRRADEEATKKKTGGIFGDLLP